MNIVIPKANTHSDVAKEQHCLMLRLQLAGIIRQR